MGDVPPVMKTTFLSDDILEWDCGCKDLMVGLRKILRV